MRALAHPFLQTEGPGMKTFDLRFSLLAAILFALAGPPAASSAKGPNVAFRSAKGRTAAERTSTSGKDLRFTLRYRKETAPGSGRYHALYRTEFWKPSQTAIIVCDMWDLHHCLNATRRGAEMAPRMNKVLKEARQRGVTIIHAPSSCMAAYKNHPARKHALAVPKAKNVPKDIGSWCYKIPAEEKGVYPIDQTDGGEDDDPAEHKAWAAKLKAMGRNPRAPWKSQTATLEIADADYITDNGVENWSILESRGIKNVILLGVHANMCVLGRPFGLRQMAKNGKHVVLMRDMTDTMYNPLRKPYVSHFTGTDLIVQHVEKYVCPTITSDQLLGGKPFRFKNDKRPRLTIIMAEREYRTNETLPKFALANLGKHFAIEYVHADPKTRNSIPGLIPAVKNADVLFVSIRRRVLPKAELAVIRKHIAAGKPILGIRTASHSFCLKNGSHLAPKGQVAWPEFDAEVWGGHYTNHHGGQFKPTVTIAAGAKGHPILKGVNPAKFTCGGSLYKTRPLAKTTQALLIGRIERQPAEPVAWTNKPKTGNRAFYTSLGYISDFDSPDFNRFLRNAVYWAAGVKVSDRVPPGF
jgi:nicotinamidase-related amidase/type 1 glutamine amidotransferase